MHTQILKGLLIAGIFTSIMAAQPPTITADDYLTEVRVLSSAQPLTATVRNDSGQTVELRILFQLTKDGKTVPRDMEVGRILAPGEVALVTPGSPGAYEGATAVTVSIDSATLADGKFIGRDTRNKFDELVAEDKARKQFFKDLTGWLDVGQTQTQITQALQTRQDQIQLGENQTAITLYALLDNALTLLERQGMAYLATWAANQNATWGARPSIHR